MTDVERYYDVELDGEIDDFDRMVTEMLREMNALPEFGPNIIEANNLETPPADEIPDMFGPWSVQWWDHRDAILGSGQDDNNFEQPEILGTTGRDWIWGFAGDDFIDARGGDDNIDGGGGQDTIVGGEGDDIIGSGLDGDDDVFDFRDSDGARDALHIHRDFQGNPGANDFGFDRVVGYTPGEDQIWLENGLQLFEVQTGAFSIVDQNGASIGFVDIGVEQSDLTIFYVG